MPVFSDSTDSNGIDNPAVTQGTVDIYAVGIEVCRIWLYVYALEISPIYMQNIQFRNPVAPLD